MTEINTVLFDLGSTLIYFDGEWPNALAKADAALLRSLQSSGLALDDGAFLTEFRREVDAYYRERDTEFIEYTTHYVLRKLLGEWGYADVPVDVLRKGLDALYAVTQSYWTPEADTVPVLERLKSRGYRMGLISNAADDKDVQMLVDKAGIRAYFETIISSAAFGIRKPNPQIFHSVLEQLGVTPQQAVMVGDTLGADILGANNAGLISIWITRHADTPGNQVHADNIRPDAIIRNLSELPKLIEEIRSRRFRPST